MLLEDPDNADAVFLVEVEKDSMQGWCRGQKEQLEIKISGDTMKVLLDQARNQQLATDEGEDEH